MPASGRPLTARRAILLVAGLVLLLALSLQRLLTPAPDAVHTFGGATMGTTWSLKLWGPALSAQRAATLADSAAGRMAEVNRLMSTWDSTSELSRFNRSGATTATPLARPTVAVVATALAVARATGGTLDITVAPLVDAWGFGPSGRPAEPPPDSTLRRLAAQVGYQLLVLDTVAGTLAKSRPEVTVDLSAVAKGYAVDYAAAALGDAEVAGFLLEIGGELRAMGLRPDGTPWRVAVERPDPAGRIVHQVVALRDVAVATSGDYRNYYERDGRRYAHLIDPRTLAPVTHAGTAVTVVADDGAAADAWATALSVLGPESGYALADSAGVAALFVWQASEGFETRATTTFTAAVESADF